MDPLRRLLLRRAFMLFDVSMLGLAFLGSAWTTRADWRATGMPASLLEREARVGSVLATLLAALVLLGVWHLLCRGAGLYRSKRLTPRRRELRDVVVVCAVAALLLAGWLAAFQPGLLAAGLVLAFWAGASLLLVLSRVVLRPLLAAVRRRGRNHRQVVVVGSGALALRYAQRLAEEPELGYRLIGFVDDEWPQLAAFRDTGRPLLGSIADLRGMLRDAVIDEVVICLPMRSRYREAQLVADWCAEQGVTVRVPAELFDTDALRPTSELEVVTLNPSRMHGAPAVVKRGIDIVVSAVLLVLLLPLFALVAVLIKLDSPGPVLFRQQRRGLHKRRFTMLKFRTMRADAEAMMAAVQALNEENGPAFKIRQDPRITRVGRYLRKLSIDELPQLVNVLRGEMSLVGPRPLFGWEFDRIDEPWVKRRCSVRPGLTGLWQVSGRSELPFDRRVQLDLEYIDTWSLDLDLRILAQTIPAVVSGRGAV